MAQIAKVVNQIFLFFELKTLLWIIFYAPHTGVNKTIFAIIFKIYGEQMEIF